MNDINTENFFETVGGANSGPSQKLSDVGDWVQGTILDQRVVDVKKFNGRDGEVEYNRDNSVRQQLAVSLQTTLRNWDGIKPSNVPWVDYKDQSKGRKPATEDDGRRAVYLPQYSNIQSAVADAIAKSNGGKPGPLRNGGTLGVKVTEHRDTGKGNPLKIHAAVYTAPSASDGFFPEDEQKPVDRGPEVKPEPASPQDPWADQPASGSAERSEEPPF